MATVPRVTVDEARLAEVCGRYGIARLRVFGSVARGTATADSDIDVLYELEPGRRLGWEIEQLADEFAAVFGRPVDLVSPADAAEQGHLLTTDRPASRWPRIASDRLRGLCGRGADRSRAP
jgi:predicted nucleotidyltransferase